MPKVLVLYYSSYGHIETMAHAVAEGARLAGAEVDVEAAPTEQRQSLVRRDSANRARLTSREPSTRER